MTILNISEAARLAGVSRNTIYEKINSGEMSRRSEGIDVAELARVFPNLKAYEDAQIKQVKKPSKIDKSGDIDHGPDREDDYIEHLSEQVEWMREMLAKREKQIDDQQRRFDEQAERHADERKTWTQQLDTMQKLLPAPEPELEYVDAPEPMPRKKILGIF